jgi:hypothetical protein
MNHIKRKLCVLRSVQYTCAYSYIYVETTAFLIKCFESHRFWKYLSDKMAAGKRDEAHIRISSILENVCISGCRGSEWNRPPCNFSTHRVQHCRKFNVKKQNAEIWVWHDNELTIVYTAFPQILMPWNQHTFPFVFFLSPSFTDPHPVPLSLRSYLLTWSPLSRPFCLDTWLSTSNIVKSQILIYCICMVCPVH